MEQILEWIKSNNAYLIFGVLVIFGIMFKRKNDKYLIVYNKYQQVIFYMNKEELKMFKTDLKKLLKKSEKKALIDTIYELQIKKREEELKKEQEKVKKIAEKYQ
ncbi:MAG: hypothetical protein SOY68_03665 [Fusobacterium varium]|uniref:hypothetical protein n=1 Tax=Fusobacterium varium TaxID=856 RepID=UPI0024330116|nr:hypothetical protein [Fusobacterium varium]MCI6033661.1 hypothetical protein [Fusobacterium varium]MDY4004990.1 hypothetical protein [Fusobacterium varium]